MYVCCLRRNNRNFPQNQSMLTQKCVTENFWFRVFLYFFFLFQAKSQDVFCYCLFVLLLLIEKKRVEDKNT